MAFEVIDEVPVDPALARVYEHGWQSWSPTTSYPVTATSARPTGSARLSSTARRIGNYRPDRRAPASGFQGEGILGLDPGDGSPAHVWAAATGPTEVPSIRAQLVGDQLRISADAPVRRVTATSLDTALGGWADDFVTRVGAPAPRPAPTAWCSWYHYFTEVTEADMTENLAAIVAHDLPVDVVQLDDGWEAQIGDWLTLSDRFSSLADVARRIRDTGRRAGIWTAPFLTTARSALTREHPDWIAGDAGYNWNTECYGLDLTHPGVRGYLREVFTQLRGLGFDYFKIDFLYAGALPADRHGSASALAAYRAGLSLIREAIGEESYLLGCGAPILPSVGLVDAMRVSPDVAPHYAPHDGDPSQPGQWGAAMCTTARAWQHGRFWVNDPDCLIVRPEVERREEWATVVERFGGLRVSSDRIAALDEWGLETTRRLLSTTPPPTPFGLPGASPIRS